MFGDVNFNAVLAVDDPSAMSLVRQPGSDGFRLDSTAMFQVFHFFSFLLRANEMTWYYKPAALVLSNCPLIYETNNQAYSCTVKLTSFAAI